MSILDSRALSLCVRVGGVAPIARHAFLVASVVSLTAWAQSDLEPLLPAAEPEAAVVQAEAYTAAQAEAAQAYGACLEEHEGSWITEPDFGACDAERSTYAHYLPMDAAELVLGCFEERLVGSARTEGLGCEALEARFVAVEGGSATPAEESGTEAAP